MPSHTRVAPEEILWTIFHDLRDQNPSKRAAYSQVMAQLEQKYQSRTGNTAERSKSLKSYGSKIMRLLFPKDEQARKNLEREIANRIPFNQALLIARGRYATRAEIPAAKRGSPPAQLPRSVPLAELFVLTLRIAAEHGFAREEIQHAFVEAQKRAFPVADTSDTLTATRREID